MWQGLAFENLFPYSAIVSLTQSYLACHLISWRDYWQGACLAQAELLNLNTNQLVYMHMLLLQEENLLSKS